MLLIVNWEGIRESLIDTWLPLIAVLAIIVAILVIHTIIKRHRKS